VQIFEYANCSTSRVEQLPVLKMCNCPFLRAKKVQLGNLFFHTFLHIRPFQKKNCAIALFKVQKIVISKFALFLHFRLFQKSNCAIALLKQLHNRIFTRATKKSDCTIALFKRVNV